MEHYGLQTASGHLTVAAESKEPYAADVLAQLHEDAAAVIARYPQPRSALLPLLHLVQSVDGYVTGRGVEFCAEVLDLSTAEVSGVATFYTQYKRHPNGDYTVGVCTNTLCAVMGGDQIWDELSEHLGVGHDETTGDGKITLERIECNAACDYAPVVMANWEFFDNQTPESAKTLVDDLRDGKPVRPSRGPNSLCTFKQTSRVLAGFLDGHADEGVGAGPASLAGLEVARENGWVMPDPSASVPAVEAAPAAPAAAPAPAPAAAPAPAVEAKAAQPEAPKAEVSTPHTEESAPKSEADEATVNRIALVSQGDSRADDKADDGALFAADVVKAADRTGFEDGGHGPGSAKPDADGRGPAGWDVKGNANSGLFHTPESPWYKRTKAEVWFRDAASAAAAGFTDALDRGKDKS